MMTRQGYAALVERALIGFLPTRAEGPLCEGQIPPVLHDAMRYSLLAGGKRLRPVMLLAATELIGGDIDEALVPACAIEMIHTYSLIHDDLPGMDDDVLRRGVPTNHMVFGVGQAILAGDGLLTHAFERMLGNALMFPEHLIRHARAIEAIAMGAGVHGMVGGQSVDLQCERGEAEYGEVALHYIHLNKTAGLFIGAMRAGAFLAGASIADIEALTQYARAFGLMFQAADDLLDAEGDATALGKAVRKDETGGKLTAVGFYGREGTRARIDRWMYEGLEALEGFDARADFFRDLIREMKGRKA